MNSLHYSYDFKNKGNHGSIKKLLETPNMEKIKDLKANNDDLVYNQITDYIESLFGRAFPKLGQNFSLENIRNQSFEKSKELLANIKKNLKQK